MVRLGVIGYGRRMRHLIATVGRLGVGARVVGLVDPRAGELREGDAALAGATVYPDAAAMLDGAALDGVLIGTRCSLHAALAGDVLARGLPLFLEKPVAIDFAQLAALREAAARSASPVVVSFPLRLSALCVAAREIIASGAIGTVEQVQAVNNVPFYAADYFHGWMRDEAETGGLWLQKATHDLDYLNFLIDQRPTTVVAMESKTVFRGDMPAGLRCVECDRQRECPESPRNLFLQGVTAAVEPNEWRCAFAVDTGNHDAASAIIGYESGLHATYTQNFYARRGAAARGATLIGYRGTVAFDWYREELTVHHHHSSRVERHHFPSGKGGHHGGDLALLENFLDVIAGRAASRAPLAAGLLSAELCLLARESCRRRAFMDVRGA